MKLFCPLESPWNLAMNSGRSGKACLNIFRVECSLGLVPVCLPKLLHRVSPLDKVPTEFPNVAWPRSQCQLSWTGVLHHTRACCAWYIIKCSLIWRVVAMNKLRGTLVQQIQHYCSDSFCAKLRFFGKVFEDFAPPLRGRFTMGKNSIVVIWTV